MIGVTKGYRTKEHFSLFSSGDGSNLSTAGMLSGLAVIFEEPPPDPTTTLWPD